MESLVANYASSDEEEEQKQQQRQSTSFRSKPISLFSSLLQPKSSSLFSSLPQPQKNVVTKTLTEEEPRNPTSNSNKSSIFSALPQPKSQTQLQPEKPAKRVVRFVPPSIKSSNNFDDKDDEDEDEKEKERKKRRESEYLNQGSSVKSFLTSIPAPKSSVVLGVGSSNQGGSGRRSIIETEASALSSSDFGTENESSNVRNAVNYQSNDQNYVDYAHYYQTAETHTSYEVGNDQNVDNFTNHDSYQTGSDDQNLGSFANYGSYQTGSDDQNVHSNYVDYGAYGYGEYGQYGSGTTRHETAGVPVSGGGRVPGKRGKNEIPTEIVEVKQDELMKDRPREDQVKLTGIAFGPSYQPVSTKGKPSKLHKRKHQIGSLFFDMKQKETELAERRARGFLTKSQTQGVEFSLTKTMSSSYLPATTESLAQALEAKSLSESISILYRILDDPSSSPDAMRIKEQAITNLSDFLREENRAEDLCNLLTQLRPFFSLNPKAKTAKIVRGIIESVAKIPGTSDLQIALCREMVLWTRAEKRTFLRQRVEARLAALLMEIKEYSEALTILTSLVKEVRRLDDKLLLVDIDLLESKLHFSLRNLPKAKAALTAARTAANAIYVPPAQQSTIDLQSGILHAEEKDYKTAYSYFFEAFEAFNALEDPRAVFSLKYMLLCKIMVSQADDVAGIISSKAGLQYVGPELDAMKAVADAHSKRSLRLFETALHDYKAQLEEDAIVHRHLSSLYDTLLEQNLCRLIEPYSRVEISHIAELIELPIDHVEKKLSQMILDKKFAGTLDQGIGCLIIFEDPKADAIYPATLETISNMGRVVDSLFVRSAKIMA